MPTNDAKIGNAAGYESLKFTEDGGFVVGGFTKYEGIDYTVQFKIDPTSNGALEQQNCRSSRSSLRTWANFERAPIFRESNKQLKNPQE